MMKGLNRSIKSATAVEELKGIKPFEDYPTSTHQQFIDDTLLHGTPMVKEKKTYKRILEEFGEASGAKINHSKSMIYFFNTNPATQRNLANILWFEHKTLPMKYLGIPLMDRDCNMAMWEGVINKLQEREKIGLTKFSPSKDQDRKRTKRETMKKGIAWGRKPEKPRRLHRNQLTPVGQMGATHENLKQQ
jgi:hypothetical protein